VHFSTTQIEIQIIEQQLKQVFLWTKKQLPMTGFIQNFERAHD
jgi:hypothetical protein